MNGTVPIARQLTIYDFLQKLKQEAQRYFNSENEPLPWEEEIKNG